MITHKRHLSMDRWPVALGLPCLIVLLGATLRFYDLAAESYWYDELITVRIAADSPRAILDDFIRGGRPPLHLLLTSLWMRAAGTTEYSTRYLSVFAGTASVAVIYAIGRRLFSRRVGLISAVLLALSEFQILYAQEARYYSLFVTFTVLSFLFYLQIVERGHGLSRGFHVLATLAMCYTHTYGVFVIVAQNLHFLVLLWPLKQGLSRRRLGAWFASQLLVLLALLPALRLGEAVRGEIYPLSWLTDPPLALVGVTLLRYVGSRFPAQATVVAATLFLACASLAFILYAGKRRWLRSVTSLADSAGALLVKKSELVLLIFWLLCPILIPWALSKVVRPIYNVRYTICAAPALYLLLALAASTIREVVPPPVILGFVAILTTPGLHEYYVDVTKEDWRGAARYMEERVRPSDAVVVPGRGFGQDAFDWYYDGPIQDCDMDYSRRDSEAVIATAKRCAGESSRLWLIYRQFMLQGRRLEEADWRAAGLRLVELAPFKGVPVYVFEKAEEGDDSGALREQDKLHRRALSTECGHAGSAAHCRPIGASPTLAVRGAQADAYRQTTDK